ncbi:hypothetical protein QM480_03510 [Flectobacillus sp. DC10W]|uniref:HMG box domain-containing protein n=1 Tax=Flectobacillus longus TaxID=2984207 RepID=A0ABT6YIG1_9BACT|nr:hypothetical protein [Flectobacillus longus]MDI9863378.1 hypothetical protein [Flectobacillus longus]
MLTAVEGVYDNGQIILTEMPKFTHKVKVFVMFTEEVVKEQTPVENNLVPASKLKGSLRETWRNIDDKDKEEIHKHFELSVSN